MKLGLDRLFGRRPTIAPLQPARRVAYDHHSMIIDGKRIVIRSGAFHYYRLPSPALWKDRLLKIKRAGYNTVDLYFFWGYHSPSNGIYDFEGPRDVDRLLALAEEVGLYVIARPGPFIDSELDGGGHPRWLLAQSDVALRCRKDGAYQDSPQYLSYVRQWYEQIIPKIVRHANVILFQIENEYKNDQGDPRYMRALYDMARELGVTVPIVHNDCWKQGYWADVVDIYGVDDYAVTSFKDEWRGDPNRFGGLDGLSDIKAQHAPKTPLAIFELQGGWFASWTGIGYDEMRRRLGRESMELVTLTALAHGTTIYNHYMFAGGTNWDHIGAPCVCTSYDCAAPLYEWGGVSERYQAVKAIATLVATCEEVFALSEPCSEVRASDPGLLYRTRKQGDAYLAFLRNFSGETRSTTLTVGDVATGPVGVGPWHMRVILLNLPFVNARVTSTCDVFTAMHQENQHLLVLCGPGQVMWTLPTPCRLLKDELGATVDGARVAVNYGGDGWKDIVFSSGGHRYRSLFVPNADELWLAGDYLVVGASYVGEGRKKGGVTDLPRYEMRIQTTGPKEKTIRIYSVGYLNRAEINDEMVHASEDSIAGYLRFEMPRPPAVTLPALGPWRVKQAVETGYPHPATGWRVLPADQSLEMDRLGIYQGFAWYRAAYMGTMARLGLAIRHNAALYLNGSFVARLDNYPVAIGVGKAESAQAELVWVDLPVALQSARENVLTVLTESLGHNTGFYDDERVPRGIVAVQADRPLGWSVRVGIAGEAEAVQPGFDDSAWTEVPDLGKGPADDVLWARTSFALDLPDHVYAPISFTFEGVADKAHIYLNGVLVGRDWSVCPQRHFYLPEGVLNAHGENVLVLLLWRRGGQPTAGKVELQAYSVEANNYVNVL